ncbi:Down syndrome cell adhesion molecule-like protein Dscam2 [Centruroides sculpturatus]|uniref:Down syndrome cell adhesion molecule-like protein Dscam2 n=1 Tax=Centruroides sculpturatus TaxID=218467 RepID=UPI000C6D9830|nr:Down syndrome cell adhesion molecule-like protein Dscam2 [Centruroides sculpturatus]XP_023225154.1 Down syndrome cell adhesion molecule-like protein Dscam2 [Centruroides sculpturatus]
MAYTLIVASVIIVEVLSQEVPKIQPFNFPKQVVLGQKVSTICTAISGNPPLEFSWLKDGREINDIDKISIQSYTTRDSSVLLIEKVETDSAGNYTCVLTTSSGIDRFSASLLVRAPTKWVQEPSDKDIVVGTSLVIECEATGLPPPNVSWRKLDGALSLESESQIGKNLLNIENIRDIDEGQYICEAKNGIGDPLNKIISITVRGKIIVFVLCVENYQSFFT